MAAGECTHAFDRPGEPGDHERPPVPPSLNQWNNYEINVTTGVTTWTVNGVPTTQGGNGFNAIPVADRPQAYGVLQMLKMAVRGTNGSADAYFDSYHLDASTPPATGGALFVYRNSIIHDYDTSTFKIFPSQEEGYSDHAQRFKFDITDPIPVPTHLQQKDRLHTLDAGCWVSGTAQSSGVSRRCRAAPRRE